MKKKPCEVKQYSRVTGYFTPTDTWNKGKTEEKKERKTYNTDKYMKKSN